jgi:hypothetical protein
MYNLFLCFFRSTGWASWLTLLVNLQINVRTYATADTKKPVAKFLGEKNANVRGCPAIFDIIAGARRFDE